ncbi:MAG: hypothetical protein AAF250_03020 [Pseudomonadota bacterium]
MDQTDRFECVEKQREPEPRIELRSRSGRSSITFDAAELVEQYAISKIDTLLVLDEDCPYEERLHLVLMRRDKVIDYVEIGVMYMPGVFKPVSARDRELRFRFESDAVWTLTIHEAGRRVIGGLPAGASRKGRFLKKRHLFLEHGDEA